MKLSLTAVFREVAEEGARRYFSSPSGAAGRRALVRE